MKKQYEYEVGGVTGLVTRESARLIQRSFRKTATVHDDGTIAKVPRIIQKLTMERVVR